MPSVPDVTATLEISLAGAYELARNEVFAALNNVIRIVIPGTVSRLG